MQSGSHSKAWNPRWTAQENQKPSSKSKCPKGAKSGKTIINSTLKQSKYSIIVFLRG